MVLETFMILNALTFGLTLGSKFIYKRINDKHDVFLKIYNEGLYHFTSKKNAFEIMESGHIRPSGVVSSYGAPKTFFFAGVPQFDDLISNAKLEDIDYEFYAIKLNLKYEQIAQFRERSLNDKAVVYNGSCQLDDKQAEIIKLVVDLNKEGNLFLREHDIEEKYEPSLEVIERMKKDKTFYGRLKLIANTLKLDVVRTVENIATLFTSKRFKLYPAPYQKDNINIPATHFMTSPNLEDELEEVKTR
ncbi:MAG: hypothetical protein PHI22_00120 [Bacilli bacterium]|nr:hypothetical protein [Bacilli bacterium]MDD4644077.1 hypothetical protein [Bacilli bacterium]